MTSALLDGALAFASAGRAVMPLPRRSKGATLREWQRQATTDPSLIEAWWREQPDANIGYLPRACQIVLDIDPRDGGDFLLAELEARHGRLSETLTVISGGTDGGRHHYFSTPTELERDGNLAKGLELRGAGRRYVVAPPSIHPSGGTYRFLDPSVPVAPLPEWALALIQPKTPRIYAPRDPSGDPLLGIDPPAYVWLLTGVTPNRVGKIPCPLHDDWDGDGGSFHAYPTADRGWYCYGCDRGGDIYTLAQHLWGDQPFPNLRRRLVAAVMGGRDA